MWGLQKVCRSSSSFGIPVLHQFQFPNPVKGPRISNFAAEKKGRVETQTLTFLARNSLPTQILPLRFFAFSNLRINMLSYSSVVVALAVLLPRGYTQQFSDLPLPPSWPGVSSTCFNALNTTVSCPGFLGQVSVKSVLTLPLLLSYLVSRTRACHVPQFRLTHQ